MNPKETCRGNVTVNNILSYPKFHDIHKCVIVIWETFYNLILNIVKRLKLRTLNRTKYDNKICLNHLAPVVQRVESTIQWIQITIQWVLVLSKLTELSVVSDLSTSAIHPLNNSTETWFFNYLFSFVWLVLWLLVFSFW